MPEILSSSFSIEIQRLSLLTHRLVTSQFLRIDQHRAFPFFEDPRNLRRITPPWLDFLLLDSDRDSTVYKNAEFEYTIRLMGIKVLWRSRIIDYEPPVRFTDIQLKGPYKSWGHLHVLEKAPGGILMRDEVTYRLYLPAIVVHSLFIKRRLLDIFRYRAVKIAEWAEQMAQVKPFHPITQGASCQTGLNECQRRTAGLSMRRLDS